MMIGAGGDRSAHRQAAKPFIIIPICQLLFSYWDLTNEDLKVAVCNNATCTSPTLTTVDSAGNVGGYTSLALNSSGFPVISYFNFTNGDLKVAVFVPPSNTIYLPLVLR